MGGNRDRAAWAFSECKKTPTLAKGNGLRISGVVEQNSGVGRPWLKFEKRKGKNFYKKRRASGA